MRIRAILTSGLVLAAIVGGSAGPSRAAPQVFEGTVAFSAPITDFLSGAEYDELVCPDAGPANGSFYRFIDLKGDFKNLKLEGPKRVVEDPAGYGIGDYDLDMFVFDAKCNDLNHDNTQYPTERFDGKKAARYVVVHYYIGVHPNLPFKLQAANEKIK